ncbi:MAG: hypothetical protein HKN81_08210 [Gammaproteobacteria bacterium]|nr:hypothetical protein [Gammaproteobacteria bacterium]
MKLIDAMPKNEAKNSVARCLPETPGVIRNGPNRMPDAFALSDSVEDGGVAGALMGKAFWLYLPPDVGQAPPAIQTGHARTTIL